MAWTDPREEWREGRLGEQSEREGINEGVTDWEEEVYAAVVKDRTDVTEIEKDWGMFTAATVGGLGTS